VKILCPKIAYGIGLNRLMHENVHELHGLPAPAQAALHSFGEACHFVSVRDPDTATLLRLYAPSPAALIGDPALFLAPEVAARPSTRVTQVKPILGLNLSAHGWRAIAVLRRLLPQFVHFLKAVLRDHEFGLTYFVHHDLERPVVAFLKDRGFPITVVDSDPITMIERYREAEFLVCQMLHSCILAANAGLPFLNIAYDRKSLSFAALLGIPDCALAHTEADWLSLRRRFDILYGRRRALAEIIERRKLELHTQSRCFLARMVEATVPLPAAESRVRLPLRAGRNP
jgi:polysaccharide pyruvyl transferase WcaK-like protein